MNTLKSGLEMFIKEVEKLDENILFNMKYHDTCVIGKTLGWIECEGANKERLTLKSYFGIENNSRYSLFCSSNAGGFNMEQWMVIRLFTYAVGEFLTKYQWLTFAKAQLEQMK